MRGAWDRRQLPVRRVRRVADAMGTHDGPMSADAAPRSPARPQVKRLGEG